MDTRLRSTVLLVAISLAYGNSYIDNPLKLSGSGPLFRILRNDKWGFMDRIGRTVIPPQFEGAGDFFSGLARVRNGDRWGYIDESGRTVVEPQFSAAGDFREGLAPVRSGNSWGYVDVDGRLVIKPQFQGAGEFQDGLARVELWDRIHCMALDADSKPSTRWFERDQAPESAFVLHRGFFLVEEECDVGDVGFVDHAGNVAIPPRPGPISDFSESRASFRVKEGNLYRWGYLDRTGSIAIAATLTQPPPDFHDGLATVYLEQNGRQLAGAIDRNGKLAIDPQFALLGSFSQGLAAAATATYKWGYVDTTGRWVIPPQFVSAQGFRDGLARVWAGDLRPRYIDRTGKTVLLLSMDVFAPWPFADGLTVVGNEGSRQYIDSSGHIVAPYEAPVKRR